MGKYRDQREPRRRRYDDDPAFVFGTNSRTELLSTAVARCQGSGRRRSDLVQRQQGLWLRQTKAMVRRPICTPARWRRQEPAAFPMEPRLQHSISPVESCGTPRCPASREACVSLAGPGRSKHDQSHWIFSLYRPPPGFRVPSRHRLCSRYKLLRGRTRPPHPAQLPNGRGLGKLSTSPSFRDLPEDPLTEPTMQVSKDCILFVNSRIPLGNSFVKTFNPEPGKSLSHT